MSDYLYEDEAWVDEDGNAWVVDEDEEESFALRGDPDWEEAFLGGLEQTTDHLGRKLTNSELANLYDHGVKNPYITPDDVIATYELLRRGHEAR